MKKPDWLYWYADFETSTYTAEQNLHFFALSKLVPVVHFDASRLHHIAQYELRAACGRIPLVRVLGELGQIDALMAKSVGSPPAQLRIHYRLYGDDEVAHTPSFAIQGNYISFNLANPRVVDGMLGIMTHSKTAIAAIVDVVVHERAHLALRGHKEHDDLFYRKKDLMKKVLVSAIRYNRNLDPFRRGFILPELPQYSDLARLFPNRVQQPLFVVA